ncbi:MULTISPECIES: peptide deformylase [unclassified Streptomyces]|uniref:peptide deformylase n=1 Tax=unclassified Streptomyces TaxID=2593676 RepID=UPI000DBA459D|nr:peptide deformylase [Streptomyces sp. PsTaAH-130]MYU04243.1 peptide deformylase [Streptomyces sp. SID8366]MYU61507.1 peptide deformylase [Streptomyces sp. SID69]RAJ49835.1 peptide deformylase [Streptomyces sp. PsTaAH-130]
MPRVFVQGAPAAEFPRYAPEAARGAVRRITEVGEAVLHKPCRDVTEFGPDLAALIDDMFRTMYVAEGAGLAANQVGVDLRLFVYDCPDDDGNRHVGHIVNPVLESPLDGRRLLDEGEGCLSVPGAVMAVPRPDRALVRGRDRDGNALEIEGTGYFARCLAHETDHTNGYIYLDRLTKREKKDALRQMGDRREEVYARRSAKEASLSA